MWTVHLLQIPRLRRPDGSVDELERKTAALLAVLAIDGPSGRSRLAGLLWPDATEERARANLRQLLLRLRKLAGGDLVEGEPLRLAQAVSFDIERLETATALGNEPMTPSLLAGLEFDDCAELADWLADARERTRRLLVTTLEAESERLERAGLHADALLFADRARAVDPLVERSQRRVMRLHTLLGDRAAALAAYRSCTEVLARQLGVGPDPETQELARQIERGAAARAPTQPQLPSSVLRPPRLVGREREWARMETAWDAGRMIFVSGPPGVGKSRLALDFAASKGAAMVIESRPGDAGVPFASQARAVRHVLHACPDLALAPWMRAELARLAPELDAGGERLPPLEGDAQRLRFFQAQVDLVRLLGARRGGSVAVVVDDLQYCDPASGEVGHYMFSHRTAGELGIRPVLTFRTGELPEPVQRSMETLIAAGIAEHIELSPLQSVDVDALVAELGVPRPAGLEVAGGLPAVILELVKSELRHGGAHARADVERLLRSRLRQLSSAALRLAQVASVAGDSLTVDLASAVLGIPPLDLAEPWRELESAQVLRGDRFVHDLLREAALAELPQALVQHLHRGIAAYLEAAHAPPTEIALHWQAGGEADKAARHLIERPPPVTPG